MNKMNKKTLMSRIVIFVDKIAEDILISSLKYDLIQSQFGGDEREIAEQAISNLATKSISKNMLVITFDSIFNKKELHTLLKDYDKKSCFVFDKKKKMKITKNKKYHFTKINGKKVFKGRNALKHINKVKNWKYGSCPSLCKNGYYYLEENKKCTTVVSLKHRSKQAMEYLIMEGYKNNYKLMEEV